MLKNNNGFILASTVGIIFVVLTVITIATLQLNKTKKRSHQLSHYLQAKLCAETGIAQTRRQLSQTNNWTTLSSPVYTGQFQGCNYTSTISNVTNNSVDIVSTGQFKTTKASLTETLNRENNLAQYIKIITNQISITPQNKINNIIIQNTHNTTPIQLTHIRVSWHPSLNINQLNQLTFGTGDNAITYTSTSTTGTLLPISNYTLASTHTIPLSLTFSSSITNPILNIYVRLSDGSYQNGSID